MQNKRLFRSLALLLVFSFVISLFAGCDTSKENASDVSVTVITTLFPLFDFARVITDGTDAEVSLLLPPGVESHSFEPSPADVIAIQRSDVFAYTGDSMETWAHEIIEGAFIYAHDLMDKLENQLTVYYEVVQEGRADIQKSLDSMQQNKPAASNLEVHTEE